MAETDERPICEDNVATNQEVSEDLLIASLRAGEKIAVETFVRSQMPWMLAVAHRIARDTEIAEECVQEAFINVFRKIDDFEGRSSIKTWVHRILVNQVLMKLRTKRRLKEESIESMLPVFDASGCRIEGPWQHLATPEEILERTDAKELIHSKINELPENYRIILHLRDIEELNTQEVADALGLTTENVKVRLHRARAALKKLLEPILKGEL